MVQHGSKDKQPASLAQDWRLKSNEAEVALLLTESLCVLKQISCYVIYRKVSFLSRKVSIG